MLEKWKSYFCQDQPLVLIRKKGALASLAQYGRDSQWQSIPHFCNLFLSCFLPSHLVIRRFHLILHQFDKPKAQMCVVDGAESAIKKGGL